MLNNVNALFPVCCKNSPEPCGHVTLIIYIICPWSIPRNIIVFLFTIYHVTVILKLDE